MKTVIRLSLIVFIAMLVVACSSNETNSNQDKPEENNSSEASENNNAVEDSKFPEKPIEVVVPYAPGGTADIIARIMADGVEKYLPNNASVAVINTAGGGGTVGMTDVYQSEPDGYKIAFTPFSTMTIQPHYGNAVYNYDDFDPLLRVTYNPNLLVVRSDSEFETFEQWKDFVQNNPEEFVLSLGNPGGETHLILESLLRSVDAKAKIVPADGDAAVASNVLGGHADGAVLMPIIAGSHIESGEMRALLNLTEHDIEGLGDIPYAKDKGIDIEVGGVALGFVAPKGLPDDVFEILSSAFKNAIEDEEVIEKIVNTNNLIAYASPEESREIIETNYNDYGEIAKEIELSQ